MGAPLVPLYSIQPSGGLGVHVLKGGGVWYGKSVEGPDVQPELPREGAHLPPSEHGLHPSGQLTAQGWQC